jgi:hypothetical protein
MNRGKNICNQLKEIRRGIARDNGIDLDIPECTFEGECEGTCPRCEAELQYLERELTLRTVMGKAAVIAGLTLGISGGTLTAAAQDVAPDHQNHTKTIPDINPSKSDTCIFKGSIIDSATGEPLMYASVVLKDKNDIVISGGHTDFDGNFTIHVPKGKYEVVFANIGYATQRTTLNLNTDTLNIGAAVLLKTAKLMGQIPVMIVGMPRSRSPLIDMGAPESGERIDADRISHFPQ